MALVIGLVGEKGGGKGTFAKILGEIAPKKRICATRFSDLLRETLDVWHIPSTRANLQHLAVVMDEGFGVGTLSNAMYERVSQLAADIVIIDGVRWETDVELVRKFPKNLLVYVTADVKIRYERTIARGEKSGESTTSFEQFMREEQATNELLIPKFGSKADCIIKNEGTLAEYKTAVASCYATHIAPHFSE